MNRKKKQLKLIESIAADKDSLQELTSELVKIPTENPPGNNYCEICNFLEKRLKKSGFQTQLIRAEGNLGDSEKFPRWNLIARHDNGNTGECIHFNSHTEIIFHN